MQAHLRNLQVNQGHRVKVKGTGARKACLCVPFELQISSALTWNIYCWMVCRYIFRISWSSSHIEIVGSRSREQKTCLCILFVGALSFIERQSCLLLLPGVAHESQYSNNMLLFCTVKILNAGIRIQENTFSKFLH